MNRSIKQSDSTLAPIDSQRRDFLRLASLSVALPLAACGTSASEAEAEDVATSGSSTGGSCVLIPQETDGPYPLYAMLSNSSMVRSNITEGKAGVPLTVTLSLQDLNKSCAAIANAAVYIWHCDKDGAYSGYSSSANGSHAGETFCRGIQVTGADGKVTFTTVFPGWYTGRITHIHFQIYLNDNLKTTAIATSQLAFPQSTVTAVYNSSLYSAHGQNSSVTSIERDGIFSDGHDYQVVVISGDLASGYVATLNVGIAG